MSHDYYSMPLIPIAALSLGTVLDFIIVRLNAPRQRVWAAALTLAVVGFITVDGLSRYLPTTVVAPQLAEQVTASEEIGSLVNHSTNTIFLTPDYGSYLKYYGEIAGYNWPTRWDFYAAQVAGRPSPTVEERFNEIMAETPYQYFIVTDFEEYDLQTDLADFLESHFTVLKQTPTYIIYDLQEPLPATT